MDAPAAAAAVLLGCAGLALLAFACWLAFTRLERQLAVDVEAWLRGRAG